MTFAKKLYAVKRSGPSGFAVHLRNLFGRVCRIQVVSVELRPERGAQKQDVPLSTSKRCRTGMLEPNVGQGAIYDLIAIREAVCPAVRQVHVNVMPTFETVRRGVRSRTTPLEVLATD
eukprot:scaffold1139_cov202-Prasinococcus_capsulatus_cf.AAC.3